MLPALLLTGITGSISGTLKDPSGAVIPRVMLTLTNALMGLHFQAVTDQNGSYSFPSLPGGRCQQRHQTGQRDGNG
jgi:hypothetical protein